MDRPAASLISQNLGNSRHPFSVPDVNSARYLHTELCGKPEPLRSSHPLPRSPGTGRWRARRSRMRPAAAFQTPLGRPWSSARSASIAGRPQSLHSGVTAVQSGRPIGPIALVLVGYSLRRAPLVAGSSEFHIALLNSLKVLVESSLGRSEKHCVLS